MLRPWCVSEDSGAWGFPSRCHPRVLGKEARQVLSWGAEAEMLLSPPLERLNPEVGSAQCVPKCFPPAGASSPRWGVLTGDTSGDQGRVGGQGPAASPRVWGHPPAPSAGAGSSRPVGSPGPWAGPRPLLAAPGCPLPGSRGTARPGGGDSGGRGDPALRSGTSCADPTNSAPPLASWDRSPRKQVEPRFRLLRSPSRARGHRPPPGRAWGSGGQCPRLTVRGGPGARAGRRTPCRPPSPAREPPAPHWRGLAPGGAAGAGRGRGTRGPRPSGR